MIGKVIVGKSFLGCIEYCLEDKQSLSAAQRLQHVDNNGLQHVNRAEVLCYNQCFGNAAELAAQFNEVRRLNSRVQKPVLHLSISLAGGETLSKNQLIEIAEAVTAEFKVDRNQYVCVMHKDTKHPHLHLVANRVGYDGKVASDSNSYLRMANLCRKLELKYNLKQVLNPRPFQTEKERLLPRQNARMNQLKTHIHNSLQQVQNYDQFEQKMKSLGYQVLRGRGIAFIDDKKVKIKGSEVGYSLMTIEKILRQKQGQHLAQKQEQKDTASTKTGIAATGTNGAIQKSPAKEIEKEKEPSLLEKQSGQLLYDLLKPETAFDPAPLLQKKKKRKKKHKLRPGL
ncbi:relaxase/mobilization nuclease domain-containing protein [Niastella populi]|uniref:Relaxase n=1 Tax=Niastella populi TaxID=550983 RepID=A0A1V9EP70_9BACT|nr:relaxase/mobilization nuclease domain-containing protein [Niastella populi]OQP47949.1 relaxase [Niastella populi]